jgi:hypothetical protein
MGTQKVIIEQTVIDKLNALVEILFDKDYFYIQENAKEYVDIFTILCIIYQISNTGLHEIIKMVNIFVPISLTKKQLGILHLM